ncbi:DUF6355 family natural product biosynthesis protein [Plantactinospora sp. DSM 117369]
MTNGPTVPARVRERAKALRLASIGAGAVALALGLGVAPSVASAAPAGQGSTEAGAAATPCGYVTTTDGFHAYYNHCDSPPRTDVVINVDTIFAPDYELCVKPGLTYLGRTYDIRYAVYVGRTCNAG